MGKRREDYMTLVPLDPYYRIFNKDNRHFDYWRDSERAENEIQKFSPADVEGRKIHATDNGWKGAKRLHLRFIQKNASL